MLFRPRSSSRRRSVAGSIAVQIQPLEVRTLLSATGQAAPVSAGALAAANTLSIPGEGQNALSYLPDGSLASLLWRGNQLVYRVRDVSGNSTEEVVTDDQIGGDHFHGGFSGDFGGDYRDIEQAQLLVAPNGTSHVLLVAGYEDRLQHYRRASAGWELVETAVLPDSALPIIHFSAAVGPGGVLHAAMTLGDYDVPGEVFYGSTRSGTWQFAHVVDTGDPKGFFKQDFAPRYFALAVDSSNAAHIVYTPEFVNAQNGDGTLRSYSRLAYASNRTGTWRTQVIMQPADDSGDAGLGADIAVSSTNQVAVASFYVDRVSSGSPDHSQLMYHVLQGSGQWTSEVVTNSPDGYSAGDGPRFTGFAPQLKFDRQNRPHIVFSDHASEHFPGSGAYEFAGQIRHAVKNQGSWSLETVFRQNDPVRNQMFYPTFALASYETAYLGMRRRDTLTADLSIERSEYFVEFFTQSTGVDPRPRIAVPAGGAYGYLESTEPLVIAPGVVISSSISSTFANGVLTVSLVAGKGANDQLGVRNQGSGAGQIGVQGTSVRYAGVAVGTLSGGTGGVALRIALNSHASLAAVQSLVRNITFRTQAPGLTTAERSIEFRLSDGSGNNSLPAAAHVRVVPISTSTTNVRMYRAYNPNADYHFFTTSVGEFANAVAHGYSDESTDQPGYAVFEQYVGGSLAIHRMYNPNNGRHYYTLADGERDILVTLGWRYEKDEGYMAPTRSAGTTEIFRLYNRLSGVHIYTADAAEKNAILAKFPGIWQQHSSLGFATLVSSNASAVEAAATPQPISRTEPARRQIDVDHLLSLGESDEQSGTGLQINLLLPI